MCLIDIIILPFFLLWAGWLAKVCYDAHVFTEQVKREMGWKK